MYICVYEMVTGGLFGSYKMQSKQKLIHFTENQAYLRQSGTLEKITTALGIRLILVFLILLKENESLLVGDINTD